MWGTSHIRTYYSLMQQFFTSDISITECMERTMQESKLFCHESHVFEHEKKTRFLYNKIYVLNFCFYTLLKKHKQIQ